MDKIKALLISIEIPTFTYILSFIGVSIREIIRGNYAEQMPKFLLFNSVLIILFFVLVYTVGHVGYSINQQARNQRYHSLRH